MWQALTALQMMGGWMDRGVENETGKQENKAKRGLREGKNMQQGNETRQENKIMTGNKVSMKDYSKPEQFKSSKTKFLILLSFFLVGTCHLLLTPAYPDSSTGETVDTVAQPK